MHTFGLSNEQEMALASYLRRARAEEGFAECSLKELGIEATPSVESYLAREDRTVMEAPAAKKSRCIEVSRLPPEAERIMHVAFVHGPPVRSKADYADVHGEISAVSMLSTARVWSIRSGSRR